MLMSTICIKSSRRENSEYIPEGDNEIAYTKMLGGGESDTITFDAPEQANMFYLLVSRSLSTYDGWFVI